MNESGVRAVPIMNGYEGQFRRMHRSAWEPVQVNGIPQLFATEEKALLAAYEARDRHLFGDGIVRWGERAGRLKLEADKLFVGKGRIVEQVRR